MDNYFLIDTANRTAKKYEDFFSHLSRPVLDYSTHIATKDLYELFCAITTSFILNRPVTLLDTDAPNALEKYPGTIVQQLPNPYPSIGCANIASVLRSATRWRINLLTSGTTGIPKSVTHTFSSLTRSIKTGDHRINDIWGLAYNPTHMAGLQVFFQALLNQNTLVNLFSLPQQSIFACLKKYHITHLSATPTFYKILLPCSEVFEEVKQLTFGGEKFSKIVAENLHSIFPGARFTNVYGSTEAGTLFATQNDGLFRISEQNREFFKVTDGELLVHQSMLGTADDMKIEEGWYHTGDMVNILSDTPFLFSFISRKSEMINVGGAKVNPNEVEEELLGIGGIADARVYGKSNSVMGNILCAEIVANDPLVTDKFIRNKLRETLAEYKIPRSIKFLDALEITRTGKKRRS